MTVTNLRRWDLGLGVGRGVRGGLSADTRSRFIAPDGMASPGTDVPVIPLGRALMGSANITAEPILHLTLATTMDPDRSGNRREVPNSDGSWSTLREPTVTAVPLKSLTVTLPGQRAG